MYLRNEFEIKVHIGRVKNKTFVTLTDEFACPICPFVSCFMESISGAINTLRLKAYYLKFALNYFKSLPTSIDISARVESGDFLSKAEIRAFVNTTKYQKDCDHIKKEKTKIYTNKYIENAIYTSSLSISKVRAKTSKGRIKILIDFLDDLYLNIHSDNEVPELVKRKYDSTISYLASYSKSLVDFDTVCLAAQESAIPSEIFFRLLDIISPKSALNPFKHSKLRNFLIVSTILESGLRRGAVAKLKIGDLKLSGSFDEILVHRRPDDPTDPRADRPAQKTKAHKAFIPSELMHELKRYIDEIRSKYPEAQKHEMIFISEMNTKNTAGKPLTLRSINNIFNILSKALGFSVYPHLLRRKWNELFTDCGIQQNYSNEELEKLSPLCQDSCPAY